MRLKNKVAIVTGGARDIGRAISCQLAREGAKVVINYFDSEDAANETLSMIESEGGEGLVVYGDMTKMADTNSLVEKTKEAYGEEIHILVNVAGGLVGRKKIVEMDEDFFDFVVDLNFKSVYLATKAAVPFMPAGSAIVNFSSLAARDGGGPGASAYAAAKGAVMTYTRSMAKELGPQGIRVNSLAPGVISTTFHDTFSTPQIRANISNATALRREGSPQEVADLVAYLASADSSFLSGNNIDINGGLAFS
ncbi:SDR family NAD(P)-dependent oxidoreductase [Mucilaginibacter terrae]|uniref:3-oxoacyl-[acyl-carrier protein] reductase n=1 Tax=Mucilaginibacter terrae TaxID=1955052 RepID=A0ABU3GR18_9SPHI|nr:SDR family oxidoreductase [Mucilaginibacter terrae]MDT3402211.1 3-oxoacyl-[acyl-carrier protein] reductase [Mucilaginibacter terrae]